VRLHDLHVAGRSAEPARHGPGRLAAARGRPAAAARPSRRTPEPAFREHARELPERPVHLTAELGPVGDVGGHRDRYDHARDGESRDGADPRAKAHASRSTYPTPLTLWITSGASSSASLRRR